MALSSEHLGFTSQHQVHKPCDESFEAWFVFTTSKQKLSWENFAVINSKLCEGSDQIYILCTQPMMLKVEANTQFTSQFTVTETDSAQMDPNEFPFPHYLSLRCRAGGHLANAVCPLLLVGVVHTHHPGQSQKTQAIVLYMLQVVYCTLLSCFQRHRWRQYHLIIIIISKLSFNSSLSR